MATAVSNRMVYKCPHEGCEASYNKPSKLEIHMCKHTGQRPFVCSHGDCDKTYTKYDHLKRHMVTHFEEKLFSCPEEGCNRTFVFQSNVNKHVKRFHQGDRFKCEFEGCGQLFRKHQHLKTHQYDHTNIKPYKCEQEGCNAAFLVPSKLKRHAKIHQGYQCSKDNCTAKFDKWSELRKHQREHVEEHNCEKCGKTFTNKRKLHIHSETHLTEREIFHCTQDGCQKTFLKNKSLLLHVRNYHEGQRPYACFHEGCTKTFKHKISLVRHQVVHDPNWKPKEKKPRKKVCRLSMSAKLSGYKVKTNQVQDANEGDSIAEGELRGPMEGITLELPSEDMCVTKQSNDNFQTSFLHDFASETLNNNDDNKAQTKISTESGITLPGSEVITNCTCKVPVLDIENPCKLHVVPAKA